MRVNVIRPLWGAINPTGGLLIYTWRRYPIRAGNKEVKLYFPRHEDKNISHVNVRMYIQRALLHGVGIRTECFGHTVMDKVFNFIFKIYGRVPSKDKSRSKCVLHPHPPAHAAFLLTRCFRPNIGQVIRSNAPFLHPRRVQTPYQRYLGTAAGNELL